MDKQINLSLLSLIILVAGVFITNQLTQQSQEKRVKAGSAAPCEDPRYCYDPCSRKPDVANPDEVCLRQHPNFPKEGCLGCEFPPPACCEVIAQTGNAGACCHYPEYNWCRPEQCAKVTFFPKGEANYDPAICGGAWRHFCAKAPTQIPSTPTSFIIPTVIIPTVLPPSPTVWPTVTSPIATPTLTRLILPPVFPTSAPLSAPTAVATFTPTPTPSFTMEKVRKETTNYLQKIFSSLRFFLTAILP